MLVRFADIELAQMLHCRISTLYLKTLHSIVLVCRTDVVEQTCSKEKVVLHRICRVNGFGLFAELLGIEIDSQAMVEYRGGQ